MKRLALAAIVAAGLSAAPAAAEDATPSFDCAKAATATEKAICDDFTLPWYDRQMAQAYKQALVMLGRVGEGELSSSQSAFLKRRDACGAATECIEEAYLTRFRELNALVADPGFDVSPFQTENGFAVAARYPSGLAALYVHAVSDAGNVCFLQADDAKADGQAIHWSQNPNPDFYDDACTIVATREGDTLTIASEGAACQDFCGLNATIDGAYTLK